MGQASDLLNGLDGAQRTTGGAEAHIVIGRDRFITVPSELKRIAVQGDHNVETVVFDCPRYWDEHDLSTMRIYINYVRPDGKTGSFAATNIIADTVDPDIFHFSWTISSNVSQVKGKIRFLVCAKSVDEFGTETNHWNSELNYDLYVSEGLACVDVMEEMTTDLITQILTRLDNIEVNGTGNANIDVTAKIGQTIRVTEVDADGKPTKWEAADYQPRTHWVEREEILSETTAVITDDGSGEVTVELPSLGLTVGATYEITYNGVKYTCEALDAATIDPTAVGMIVLGNIAMLLETGDTGEPFILVVGGNDCVIGDLSGAADITIAITLVRHRKIDQKFVPNANWNAGEGKTGYVENRTHWIERSKGDVMIEETTIPLTDGATELHTGFTIPIGASYIIVYNGVEYECTAMDASVFDPSLTGVSIIGNIAYGLGTGNTGEPFAILSASGYIEIMDVFNPEATSCTIASYLINEIIHKLDNKFIDAEWMATEVVSKGEVVKEAVKVTGDILDVNGAYLCVAYNSMPTFEDDTDYLITFNGVEYVCRKLVDDPTVQPEEQTDGVGNLSLVNPALPSTGEPFIIIGNMIAWSQSVGDTVTWSIHKAVMTPNKLPAKFLPDGYAGGSGDGGTVDLTGYAKTDDIPTKTSDLENDSGFVTNNHNHDSAYDVKGSANTALSSAKTYANNLLSNVGSSHTHTMSQITNFPTTLKNPYALTFTGSVTGAYDGSSSKTVNIVGRQGSGSKAELFNGASEATGFSAHAEGNRTIATGSSSHAEGIDTYALGYGSHTEGCGSNNTYIVTGDANATTYSIDSVAFTEVGSIIKYEDGNGKRIFASITEINRTDKTITLNRTLSETALTDCTVYKIGGVATGEYSHVEGWNGTTTARATHVEGYSCMAHADWAHAEGYYSIANGESQHVQGSYNVPDETSIHIVGNGSSVNRIRSNAHTLAWDGTAWFARDVYVGSEGGINKDSGSERLARVSEVPHVGYADVLFSRKDLDTADTTETYKLFRYKYRSQYIELEAGESYTVIVNGVPYTTAAVKYDFIYEGIFFASYKILGNPYITTLVDEFDLTAIEFPGRDLPFCVCTTTAGETDPDETWVYVPTGPATTSLEIVQGEEQIYEIDERCIPETIARTADVNALINAAVDARLRELGLIT